MFVGCRYGKEGVMSVSVREKNLIGLQRKNEELREIEMRIAVFQTLRLYTCKKYIPNRYSNS